MKTRVKLFLSLIFIALNIFAGREYYEIIDLSNTGVFKLHQTVNYLPVINPKSLILSDNRIKKFKDLFKLNPKFSRLEYIDLSGNEIESIDFMDFSKLAHQFPYLRNLSLSINNFSSKVSFDLPPNI